jgi:chemotaxis protein MotB
MPRRRRHDDHDNHEAWAIPYGDLVTLLLAFFVVMYAMSSVNEGKYRVLSDSLTEAFHGTPRSPQPIEAGGTRLQPIEQLPLTQVHRMISSSLPVRHIVPAVDTPLASTRSQIAAAPTDPSPHDQASSFAEPGVAAPGSDLDQRRPRRQRGAVIADRCRQCAACGAPTPGSRSTSAPTFCSAAASRSCRLPAVEAALQRLADVLKTFPNAIRVEGHTDDRRISTAAFPFQLGAVGGTRRQRRAPVHGSRHRRAGAWRWSAMASFGRLCPMPRSPAATPTGGWKC